MRTVILIAAAVVAYLWYTGNPLYLPVGVGLLVGLWYGGGLRVLMTPDLTSDVGNNQLHLSKGDGKTTIVYKRPSQFNRLVMELPEGTPVTHYRVQPRYVNHTNVQFNTQRQAVAGRSTQIFGSYSAPARTANSHLNSVTVTLFHEGAAFDPSTGVDLKVATRASPSTLTSVRRYRW